MFRRRTRAPSVEQRKYRDPRKIDWWVILDDHNLTINLLFWIIQTSLTQWRNIVVWIPLKKKKTVVIKPRMVIKKIDKIKPCVFKFDTVNTNYNVFNVKIIQLIKYLQNSMCLCWTKSNIKKLILSRRSRL